MKHITSLFFVVFATYIFSAGDGAPCGDYGECDTFKPDLWNNESLQKGFSTYINYCYGCHSLKYSRWNRIATDLDIPEDLMFKYLIFDSEVKSGDLMTGSMIKFNAEQWFGVAPPDLTLVTRAHSPEWVYTYLRTFYEDGSKPYFLDWQYAHLNKGISDIAFLYAGLVLIFSYQLSRFFRSFHKGLIIKESNLCR